MARKPRVYSTGGIYHVILRGNNKQNLFYSDSDRVFFLNRMNKYAKELSISIYAFCLMNNHVHILLGDKNHEISRYIQKIANSYVFFFNRKYERTGHLFQGRFKSEAINSDLYFKNVFRYIIHNSEKANIEKYDKYKWNSEYLLKKHSNSVEIDVNFLLKVFDSMTSLEEFLSIRSDENFMEYKNKYFLSDSRAISIIRKLMNYRNPQKILELNLENQLHTVKELMSYGITRNQISRITGLSKGIVYMIA